MSTMLQPRTSMASTDTPDAPDAADTATALSSLRRGARARILAVSTSRGPRLAQRLADLGMEPGRCVEVVRRAPLGDPTVYRVADYELCLRRTDASLVLVEAIT